VREGPTPIDEFGDPSRRTYLAAERTLLAWWRTAFGAIGVALAVGRLLPDIAHLPRDPFLGLGVSRQRRGHRAIQAGGFDHLNHRMTSALALFMLILTAATVGMLFWSN
jgi:uncharacterized membrane protein YidH (DUF202 family)